MEVYAHGLEISQIWWGITKNNSLQRFVTTLEKCKYFYAFIQEQK